MENDMNVGECMEYAQKLCDATTAAARNEARAELRAAIDATVAAERERCAKLCESLADEAWETHKRHADSYNEGQADSADACAAAIRGPNV